MTKKAAAAPQAPPKKEVPAALRKAMAKDVETAHQLDRNAMKKVRVMVEQLKRERAKVEELTAELKTATDAANKTSQDILPTLLVDELGVSELTLEDGTKVKVETHYHPQVLVENRPKFHAWLRENGFGALIKNEVKASFGMGEEAEASKLYAQLLSKKYDVKKVEAVHPTTFKAFVNEQMKKEAPLPSVVDTVPLRETKLKG